ncbi:MAG: VanZ family protein [Inhella sp.]
MSARRSSSAAWLALGYAALVVYASLYPFGPWAWPAGMPWQQLFRLPWPRYWIQFDIWANAVGYLPLGLLLFVTVWRAGRPRVLAFLLGAFSCAALAYALEVTQYFVDKRVPSLGDWVLNSGGGLLGALLGLLLVVLGVLDRGARWRERWFLPQGSAGLALLALWPLGLLFPPPLPLAQGQFLPALLATAAEWLQDTPWASELPVLAGNRPSGLLAGSITGLGVLAPCLLMLALTRQGWHRVALVFGALAVGVGMTSVSAALGFGPQQAWSWPTPSTLPGLLTGTALALLCALLPARLNAVLALPVFTALLVLVNGLAPDVYWQQSLLIWEQGAMVKLYGLTQWLGWWWPLLGLGWCMARVTASLESRPL